MTYLNGGMRNDSRQRAHTAATMQTTRETLQLLGPTLSTRSFRMRLNAKRFCLSDEIRYRARGHFFHRLSTMNLYRNFAEFHFRGNLLIQQAGHDEFHDLFFSSRQ